MEPITVIDNIKEHTFTITVDTKCKPLDLKRLAKEFELDVHLNKERTKVLYSVGEDSSKHIIDQAFEICSTRSKNKKIEDNNKESFIAKGFSKVTYPKNPEILAYSRPPEMIPIGCYCNSCSNIGPISHSSSCPKPKKISLYLTLQGFLTTIYTGKYSFLDELDESELSVCVDTLIELIDGLSVQKNKKKKKKEKRIVDISLVTDSLTNLDKDVFNEIFTIEYDDFKSVLDSLESKNKDKKNHVDKKRVKAILTRISLSKILPFTKKEKEGKYFAGPAMITYNRYDGKHVTIRIRQNGSIELISNPRSNIHLYKTVIDRINQTSQNVQYVDSDIKTLFSSVDLIKEGSNKHFDVKKIFKYLWPVDEKNNPIIKYPKEVFDLEDNEGVDPYYYIKHGDNLYRYSMKPDKNSKNRLYADLITCEIQTTDDYETLITGPYKISVQLFSQGHLQLTFGHCKESDETTSVKPDLTVTEQLEEIPKIFKNVQLLFCHYISELIKKDPATLVDVAPKQISKKIFPTVLGILPYAKRKKFRKGDKVQLFDEKEMNWSNKIGKVVEQNDSDSDYVIEFKKKTKKKDSDKKESIKTRENHPHQSLRRIESNNDQVCRANDNGVPKQPYPYSFYGNCPGGSNQIIKPIGTISRADNRRYPGCSEIKRGDKDWTLNFLMGGLTDDELKEGSIEKIIIETNNGKKSIIKKVDKFSGTFIPGTTDIGANILVKRQSVIGDEYVNAIIIDKWKTHGKGNDSNTVYYKVMTVDEDSGEEEEFEVTGKDFHTSFIEQRDYRGLDNMIPNGDQQKKLLIKCAEKLNLVRPEILLNKENEKVQMSVLKHISKLFKTSDTFNYHGRDTMALTGKSVKHLSNKTYIAAVVPSKFKKSIRCMLCIFENEQYLVDTENRIMKVSVNTTKMSKDSEDSNEKGTIIDGFARKEGKSIIYYPIDLLIKNGHQTKKPYLNFEKGEKGVTKNSKSSGNVTKNSKSSGNVTKNSKSSGRLEDMCKIVSKISASLGHNGIIIQNPVGTKKNKYSDKFIGPTGPSEKGLVSFIKARMERNNNSTIILIPTQGESRYLQWTNITRSTVIVQLIDKVKSNYWDIGLLRTKNGKTERAIQPNLDYRIRLDSLYNQKGQKVEPALYDFVRIKINMMMDGTLNPHEPVIEPVKVTVDDFLGYEETKREIQSILFPIKKDMFMSKPWKVLSTQLIIGEESPGKPLIIEN
jgi:hypothetical protein